MDRYGITKDGFRKKTYNDILASMEAKARELYGEDVNLSERSPLGLFLQNIAWELKDIWQLGEEVYNSGYIDTAEGIPQDNVSKYVAIQRKPAQKAKGIITIEGRSGTGIPKGFRLSQEGTNMLFETTERAVLNELGVADISIEAVTPGESGNVPAHTITVAVNPIAGIDKIYNKVATEFGSDIEKDHEFRDRYYRSSSKGGASTRESVEAALLNLPSITDAFVEENDSMQIVDGVPPKSLAPYVIGGEDLEIAETILKTKAGGIRSYGSTEIQILDSKGKEHIIGFTRSPILIVYVKVLISKGSGYVGDSEVIKSILNYIGGSDEAGEDYKGLRLGEDVVISKIISAANLRGVDDVAVEVSLDGINYSNSNIEVGTKEIAKTSFDKVVISYA